MIRQSTEDATLGHELRDLTLRRVRLRKVGFETADSRSISMDKVDWDRVEVYSKRDIGDRLNALFELILILYINANGKDGMVFRAIVEQVGLFKVTGYPENEISDLLRTKGAEMLYPYAREFILSMIGRAGLEQFSLKPMTFDLPDGP